MVTVRVGIYLTCLRKETDLWTRTFKKEEEKTDCLVPAGIEPATLSVWRTRDNHYTKEPAEQGGNCFVETFLQYKNIGCVCHHSYNRGLVAQRITRLTTDQKIAGSNPAEIGFLSLNRLNVYDWDTWHDIAYTDTWTICLFSCQYLCFVHVDCYAQQEKGVCAPGWARTTNLSVNSRTR